MNLGQFEYKAILRIRDIFKNSPNYDIQELVNHLRRTPGKIHAESFLLPDHLRGRVNHKWILRDIPFDADNALAGELSLFVDNFIIIQFLFSSVNMLEIEEMDYAPAPHNLTLYKGIKSFRLPRWFVSFLLTHPVARDFIEWAMFTTNTEEHTVQTLARISQTELLDNGKWRVKQERTLQVMSWKEIKQRKACRQENGHLQNWGDLPCHGYWRNSVCVWSLPDLPTILKDRKMYVINKFRSDRDPFIIECIRKGIILIFLLNYF